MASKNEQRIKKLEQQSMSQENRITKIIVSYINPDGSVDSRTVRELIDGVWHKQTEEVKSTN